VAKKREIFMRNLGPIFLVTVSLYLILYVIGLSSVGIIHSFSYPAG